MARMAALLTFGLLVLGASAQDVASQAAQQAGILVGDLVNKNLPTPAPVPSPSPSPAPVASPSPSPSPSPTVPPATTPYIPAPVIVTTPIPTSPPVPTTPAPITTPAPPTTLLTTKCLGTQYLSSNGTCLACGGGLANGTCTTSSATIVGGRCNGAGACVGTQVTLCSGGSSSTPCPLYPGKFVSYCDPITTGDAALYAAAKAGGFSGVLESGNEALPRCNSSYDCPLGQWCDAYYTSGAFAGECVPAC